LQAIVDADVLVGAVDVRLDGVKAEVEFFGNLLVTGAGSDFQQDL
jgi:hypothetical protein